MTDDEIEDEGVKSMSEMLKVNTTLTSLNLEGAEYEMEEKKKRNKNE